MQSTMRSIFTDCKTCKLGNPRQQCQTLMPQNFVPNSSKTFFVVANGLIFGGLASVPFDPRVDPGPYVCFNCWTRGHSHVECHHPNLRYFCINCGRKNVMTNNCPRCALAYLHFGMQRMEHKCRGAAGGKELEQLWPPRVNPPLTICEYNEVSPICTSLPSQRPVTELQAKSSGPGPFNLYFKALRDVVVQNIHDAKTPTKAVEKRVEDVSFVAPANRTESSVSSGIGEECLSDEEDEDLDRIVVDENEKPRPRRPPSDGVREFLNLMDAVKHLPVDVQSSVALQFVRKRRVLMNEKKEKVVEKC